MTTTPAKGLSQPLVGGDNNTWGGLLNASLTLLDNALGGTAAKSISGNIALSGTEAQNTGYHFTGPLTGTATITWPSFSGMAAIRNSTTGGFSIICGISGATVTVLNGETVAIWSDGADFVRLSQVGGGIGSTGTGNVVLASSPTLTTPNIGSATASGISITPTGSSTAQSLNSTQTAAGSISADTYLNEININSDAIMSSDPDANVFGLAVNYSDPTGATNSTRFALAGRMLVNGAPGISSTANNYCGLLGFAQGNTTITGGGYVGAFNANVLLQSGASGFTELVSGEFDMTAQAAIAQKEGIKIVEASSSVFSGSVIDGSIVWASQPGAVGWKNLMLVRLDENPLNSACSIFSTYGGTATIANGIDFSGLTFTGGAFVSKGMAIDGAGTGYFTTLSTIDINHNININQATAGTLLKLAGVGGGTTNANCVAIVAAATGNPPFIEAVGADSNITLSLSGKGSSGVSINNGLTVNGSLAVTNGLLISSAVNFNNGAASNTATLTNAPTSGNPTKWIPINDNGTTRYIPAW